MQKCIYMVSCTVVIQESIIVTVTIVFVCSYYHYSKSLFLMYLYINWNMNMDTDMDNVKHENNIRIACRRAVEFQ